MSASDLAPSVDSLALEYLRLLEEGWEPDLEEFLQRVPENQRNECRTRIDELLELNGLEAGAATEPPAPGLDSIAQEIPPHEEQEEEDDRETTLDDDNPVDEHPDNVETEVGEIAMDALDAPAVKVRSGLDELMRAPVFPEPTADAEPPPAPEPAPRAPRPVPRTLEDLGAASVPDEEMGIEVEEEISTELYPAEEVKPDELEEAPAPRFQIRPPERKEKSVHDQLQAHMRDVDHWSRKGDIPQGAGDKLIAVYRELIEEKEENAERTSRINILVLAGAVLAASAAALTVLFARGSLHPVAQWIFPVVAAGGLLGGGIWARMRQDWMPGAIFLATGALALVPATLALLVAADAAAGGATTQLFPDTPLTNFRLLVACVAGLSVALCGFVLQRRALFAWTSTVLGVAAYASFLLTQDALAMSMSDLGLWLLPLVLLAAPAVLAERSDRARWATPLYLVAAVALVAGLDAAAPRLLTGLGAVSAGRAEYLGFAAVGLLLGALMIVLERLGTVNLRRGASFLEPLVVLHLLVALHLNAAAHGTWGDVLIYVGAVVVMLAVAPWRGRRWVLAGGLFGIALTSMLMLQLGLVGPAVFTISAAFVGLLLSVGTYAYLRRGT